MPHSTDAGVRNDESCLACRHRLCQGLRRPVSAAAGPQHKDGVTVEPEMRDADVAVDVLHKYNGLFGVAVCVCVCVRGGGQYRYLPNMTKREEVWL